MTTVIDTNILFCITNPKETHHAWAVQALQTCKDNGPALVCDIVFSEYSVGMKTAAETAAAIDAFDLERTTYTDDALFDAGKTFHVYKHANKGPKEGVLPDFLIGALAQARNFPLLTTNKKDFAKYFPNLTIISPP